MILNAILGSLALLSLALLLWQWLIARRFPLHRRVVETSPAEAQPGVTLLKPVKGCDPATEDCLRSWFTQEYAGPVQILFGVATAEDPGCGIIRKLLLEFPAADAQLLICGPLLGANAKVSKLVELERLAKHDLLVISDADVRVPPDLLANLVVPFHRKAGVSPGLVCCLYRLANPSTPAMEWEAVAINADFWSQVLQSQSLRPIDFALGAVMATRRGLLAEIGGFTALADCLADDYQLGHRIARRGHRIAICPVVVECWSAPMGWAEVGKHQLRWARTIRICQPLPYFFSILSNPTLWPLLWLAVRPTAWVCAFAVVCWAFRVFTARDLAQRLIQRPPPLGYSWLAPVKDLLQAAIWLLAFLGNHIEWRGVRMRLRRDGTLEREVK